MNKNQFEDSFDWSKSFKTTFPYFLNHVTLHDSNLNTIKLTPGSELVLSIQLDAFWNKEYTGQTEHSREWPFLLIKIPTVFNIAYDKIDSETAIGYAESETIGKDEIEQFHTLDESKLFSKAFYEKFTNCKNLHKTRLGDVYGGSIDILHESEIFILLLEQNGTYIDSSLEKILPFEKKAMEKGSKKSKFSFWKKKK